LVRSYLFEVTKACGSTTNKTASFSLKHTEHTFHHWWIKQDIIVEKVNIRRSALLYKKITLLCHSTLWQVAMKHYLMTVPFKRLDKRLNLNTLEVGITITGLIRDEYIKVSKGLV